MATISEQIQQIYMGLLGRVADQEGLAYWEREISDGVLSLEQFRANIVNEQPEYAQGQGAMERQQVVIDLYDNLFDRAPDDEGLEYWVNGGGAGVNADQLVLALINGASEADQAVLDLKAELAELAHHNGSGWELKVDRDIALSELLDLTGIEEQELQLIELQHQVTLTISEDQASLLSYETMEVEHYQFGATAQVHLEIDSELDLTAFLDEQLATAVSLTANVSNGAMLSLTAEQLSRDFVEHGLEVDSVVPGHVAITEAAEYFSPTMENPCGHDYWARGSLAEGTSPENFTVHTSESGYQRTYFIYDDYLYVDSDYTPEITSDITTNSIFLGVEGNSDIAFLGDVSLPTGASLDFSELTGDLLKLTLANFHSLWASSEVPLECANSHRVSYITGNNRDARIDVKLGGDLGYLTDGTGLKSSGVASYIATEIYDAEGNGDLHHQVVIDTDTTDLKTLGFQSHPEAIIEYANIPDGVNFLLEGDGLQTFSGDYDSIGTLIANYRELVEQSTVTVTSLVDSFAPRTLEIAGVEINNTESIHIDIIGGDARIDSAAGEHAKSLVLTSASDLTLDRGLIDFPALQSLDASGVQGEFTLELADCYNDLSEVNLVGIDAFQIPHGGTLALHHSQLSHVDSGQLSVLANEHGSQQAVLQIRLDQDATLNELLDLETLDSHLKLQIWLKDNATLTLSAEELDRYIDVGGIQYAEGQVVITNAGPEFNPYATQLPGMEGGTLPEVEPQTNVSLERSDQGYERTPIDTESLASLESGTYTFTAAFIETVGAAHFSPADGADVTVNVTDLSSQALDLDAMAANGINIGLVDTWGARVELHPETTLGDANTLLVYTDVPDVDLIMTAEQFQSIESGNIVSDDNDCGNMVNVLIDQIEALEQQGSVDIDLSAVAVSGISRLMLGSHDSTTFQRTEGDGATRFSADADLGDFEITLLDFGDDQGELVTFSTAAQADRVINIYGPNHSSGGNAHVFWDFRTLDAAQSGSTIDLSGYSPELGGVDTWRSQVVGTGDEQLKNLLSDLYSDIPFRILDDQLNDSWHPFTFTYINFEAFVVLDFDKFFYDMPTHSSGTDNLVIQAGGEVDIRGDFVIDEHIYLDDGANGFSNLSVISYLIDSDDHYLLSEGFSGSVGRYPVADNPNRIGNVRAGDTGGIDLTNVLLFASEAKLSTGTITFSGQSIDNSTTLNVEGEYQVDIDALDIIDSNLTSLLLTKQGSGELNILGGSESAAITGIENLLINLGTSTGNVTLGSLNSQDGIHGDALTLVEITGGTGLNVDLGVVNGINPADFSLVNNSPDVKVDVVIESVMNGYESGYTWNFDLQAGDRVTFNSKTTFVEGRLNLGGADLIIDGEVDMTALSALDGLGGLIFRPFGQLTLQDSLFNSLDVAESLGILGDREQVMVLTTIDGVSVIKAVPLGEAHQGFDIDASSILLPGLVHDDLRGAGTEYEKDYVSDRAIFIGDDTGVLVNRGNNSDDLSTTTQVADLALSDRQIDAGDAFYYLTDNGTDSALFLFEDINNNAAVDVDEVSHILTLVGVDNATDVTESNFLDFV